jgi:hypothetical protein
MLPEPIAANLLLRVAHFHSKWLSLPISPVISIIVAILPIIGFLNAYIHPTLLHNARSSSAGRLSQLLPFVLQTIQALAATILATILLERAVPSQTLDCLLENQWERRFRAHDAGSIRQVQDSLDCCGFNSVKDRAFPFAHNGPSTCAETFGRSLPCRGPWRAAMQGTSGAEFTVAIVVGLMQVSQCRHGGFTWISHH